MLKRLACYLSVTLILVSTGLPTSATDDNGKLKEALDAAVVSGKILDELGRFQHAAQAYRLAGDYQNSVGIGLKAALVYGEAIPEAKESYDLLERIHERYVAEYGKDSPETLDALYALAEVSTFYISDLRGKKYFRAAEKIVKKAFGKQSIEFAKHNLLLAEINVLAGKPMPALRYARKVRKILKDSTNDLARTYVARSYFWSAKSLSHRGHGNSALKDHKAFIAAILEQQEKTELEIEDRKKLIDSYLVMDSPEKAVEQSLYVGRMRAANGVVKPVILYQPSLSVPIDAYKGGYVKYQFSIMPDGSTDDIVVTEREEHPQLEDAGRSTIAESQYAPAFENGTAITFENFELTLYWYPHGSGGGGVLHAGVRNLGSIGPTRFNSQQPANRQPRN